MVLTLDGTTLMVIFPMAIATDYQDIHSACPCSYLLVLRVQPISRRSIFHKLDIATILATFYGSTLFLDGLTSIDTESAEALVNFRIVTELYLVGLIQIDSKTAAALATFRGNFLVLDGLKLMDTETASILA